MDVLLFALGSHGDVHPIVGLAAALRDRGHTVAIATCPYYKQLLDRAGIPLVPLGTTEELLEVMNDPALWDGRKAFEIVVERMMLRFLRPVYELIAERCTPRKSIVVAPPSALGARVAQEKLGIPLATVHLAPAAIQSVHLAPVLPPMLTEPWVPVWLKRFQYWVVNALLVDRKCAGPVNQLRGELGLPPVCGIFKQWWNSPNLVLCMFPEWFGPAQRDWPPNCFHAGFPLWDESSVTPFSPEVEAFLQAGDPPIAFTPGSAMLHGHDFFRAAIDACEQLGRRGILLTRHLDQLPAQLPTSVRHFPFVPLSQLLPRSAAIVHHGGVGTVSQGLAAGIPHVTMPMAYDQFDNAARLFRLCVGSTVPRRQFNVRRLSHGLESLLSSHATQRACRSFREALHLTQALPLAAERIEATLMAGS